MGIRYQQGFTIVEVVLFLALTGLLLAGILGSVSNSLNMQRYRDGVELTRDKIAAQYNRVYSLTNEYEVDSLGNAKERNSDPCNSGGEISRGASNCLYVGRILDIRSNQTTRTSKMTITPVIAEQISSRDQRFGDQQATGSSAYVGDISDYTFKPYKGNAALIEEDELGWGLSAVRLNAPKTVQDGDVSSISLLILRSPVDGTVTTYDLRADGNDVFNPSDESTPLSLNDSMKGSGLKDVSFCLADRSGGIDPPQRASVTIHKAAASPSDIEVLFEESEC